MFITFNIKNKITKMIERSKCLEGQIGVLKKEQKVKSETLCKECEARKIAYTNTTNAEIANLEAKLKPLELTTTTLPPLEANLVRNSLFFLGISLNLFFG